VRRVLGIQGSRQTIRAVAGGGHAESITPQITTHNVSDDRLIVDHQHDGFRGTKRHG
jgi:hypothetical protein